MLLPALGWFGLAKVFPLPEWAAWVWVGLYVAGSLSIYLPFRMWKQQRASIAELILPHGPVPDMPIQELFHVLDAEGESVFDLGLAILDKLSTGQLTGWGRTQERRLSAPLVPIEQSYWGIAGWSYNFLADRKDSLTDEVHVWPRLLDLDGQRFYDVHVNRVQVLRIWGKNVQTKLL